MVNLFAMYSLLRTEAERLGVERQESNIRVAWEVLRDFGSLAREGDKLTAGGAVLDGDTELVDRITALTGAEPPCSTAICGSPVRSKPGTAGAPMGDRLPTGPITDTVLKKGKPYRGEVDIQGQPYLVAL